MATAVFSSLPPHLTRHTSSTSAASFASEQHSSVSRISASSGPTCADYELSSLRPGLLGETRRTHSDTTVFSVTQESSLGNATSNFSRSTCGEAELHQQDPAATTASMSSVESALVGSDTSSPDWRQVATPRRLIRPEPARICVNAGTPTQVTHDIDTVKTRVKAFGEVPTCSCPMPKAHQVREEDQFTDEYRFTLIDLKAQSRSLSPCLFSGQCHGGCTAWSSQEAPNVDYTCGHGLYEFALLVVLAASDMANLLRGRLQDRDCKEFTDAFTNGHWSQELAKLPETWQNGAVMCLLYFFALGRSFQSVDINDNRAVLRLASCIGVCLEQTLNNPASFDLKTTFQNTSIEWSHLSAMASKLAADIIWYTGYDAASPRMTGRFASLMTRSVRDASDPSIVWHAINRATDVGEAIPAMQKDIDAWLQTLQPRTSHDRDLRYLEEVITPFAVGKQPFLPLEWMCYAALESKGRCWAPVLAPAEAIEGDTESEAESKESLTFLELFSSIFAVGYTVNVISDREFLKAMGPQLAPLVAHEVFEMNLQHACGAADGRVGNCFVLLVPHQSGENIRAAVTPSCHRDCAV
ncbi:hypothetical protein IE81DRAFT_329232 [Ceraceosorus guamensis]|uniref:Uncharacterized protein n=1 Tax=Ceraceosorus guamensis TaxID=1522189 RepID=A0A316W2X5_9BASI|nr:hypothetical protein IE81DRAFT_329232 [Ceraceosorus guamensis]PWN43854.1 hypothetical protein IE81DRAFT_329232 [Ceraceosorus guamensis]